MPQARTAARKDRNHADIIKRYRAHGCSVFDVSQIAGGLDLVVGVRGVDCRVEIKDGSKSPSARKLTDAERAVFEQWAGRPPCLIETLADVDAHVAQLRSEARQA